MTQQVYQAQIGLNGLPLTLVLLSDGQCAICPTQQFKPICCDVGVEGKIQAIFDMQGFTIGAGEDAVEYVYNTTYKLSDRTMLHGWLKQLQLEQPQ